MREYAKKPENKSRTLHSEPRASRQAAILTKERAPVQREEKPNNTGLPDNLKASIENLSGYSMDDVRVHYNSDKPAQLQALAYTQGTDIHIAPGQEKHLAHEARHVIQQKQGRVQPTMQLQGININNDEKLEKEADNMTFSMQMPIVSSDQNVVQLMGAIPLKKLLKLHGIREDIETINNYDKFCKEQPLNFNTQLSMLNKVKSNNSIIQRIICNEKEIIDKQIERFKEEPLKTIGNEIESLKEEISKTEEEIKENPLLKNFNYRKIITKESAIKRLENLSDETGWRQQNPYTYMDTGSEWEKEDYLPFLTDRDTKVKQLSKANLESITNAEIHSPTEIIRFSTLYGYQNCVDRIVKLLENNTILSHYSSIDNIPVLLSKEYAISSQISLAKDNSNKGKEQELKNTGFVFFFLERKDKDLRTNTRFGKFRYSLDTKEAINTGMLSRSWVMLSDFIKAYSDYQPKKISPSQGTDGSMTFNKRNSLTGEMTYEPTDMTLEFEKFHNILAGDDIIKGLSRFATQQLYAMFGDFEKISNSIDKDLLDAVLRIFEIQVMVPGAVVPQKIETLADTPRKEKSD